VAVAAVALGGLATRAVAQQPPVQPLPAEPPPPPPVQIVAVSPPPPVYIKDFDHLAAMVKPDDVLSARMAALAARRTTGYVTMGAGLLVGAALVAGSATVWADEHCVPDLLGGAPDCTTQPNFPLLLSGSLVAVLGVVVAAVMGTGRSALIDIVNEWNSRHADRPLVLDAQAGMAPATHHHH